METRTKIFNNQPNQCIVSNSNLETTVSTYSTIPNPAYSLFAYEARIPIARKHLLDVFSN